MYMVRWGGKNDDGDDRLNRSGEQPDHVQGVRR